MELFLLLSLELTTHHIRGVEFNMITVHYKPFTQKTYLICFLSVGIFNKDSYFGLWFKFVSLW